MRDVSEDCEPATRATQENHTESSTARKRNNASLIRDLVWALPQTGWTEADQEKIFFWREIQKEVNWKGRPLRKKDERRKTLEM